MYFLSINLSHDIFVKQSNQLDYGGEMGKKDKLNVPGSVRLLESLDYGDEAGNNGIFLNY